MPCYTLVDVISWSFMNDLGHTTNIHIVCGSLWKIVNIYEKQALSITMGDRLSHEIGLWFGQLNFLWGIIRGIQLILCYICIYLLEEVSSSTWWTRSKNASFLCSQSSLLPSLSSPLSPSSSSSSSPSSSSSLSLSLSSTSSSPPPSQSQP